MRLDEFMPEYEFNEVHAVMIHAPRERVFKAMRELSSSELSPLTFLLMAIRNLPARLFKRDIVGSFQPGPFMEQMYKGGFIPLADAADSEIVFGMIGQFWKLVWGEDPDIPDPQAFLAFDDPAFAKVAANLFVENVDGSVRCSTETRIHVVDKSTWRKFAFYWRIISMGSGFIRVMWLRSIKRKAEKENG